MGVADGTDEVLLVPPTEKLSAQFMRIPYTVGVACGIVPVLLWQTLPDLGSQGSPFSGTSLLALWVPGLVAVAILLGAVLYEVYVRRYQKAEFYPITVAAAFALTSVPALLGFLAAIMSGNDSLFLASLLPGYLVWLWLWFRLRQWRSLHVAASA